MTSIAPTSSPWGTPDRVTKIADGIYEVSTPSHGGIYFSPELNAMIPPEWQAVTWNGLTQPA